MSQPGAFHKICDERVFPICYRTSKKSTKRIAGLYWCKFCQVPTYSVEYRIPKLNYTDPQKTIEGIV